MSKGASVTRAVARIESSGYEFHWFRPFTRGRPSSSVGSASIVTVPHKEDNKKESLYLLTAYHVVCDGERIWATFGEVSRRRFETFVVGVCPDIDVALLRVDNVPDEHRRQLSALEWGDSDELRANQQVLAAGFPHGQNSVKMARGIVSGMEQGNVQIDASVNAGNSGGPLLDAATNRLVGVVTSSERNAQAMNYATPITQVRVRLHRLLNGGMDALPSFNIRTSLATPALLASLGASQDGSYVRFVHRDTPLYAEGGLRKGDVLLALKTTENGWMRVGVDGDIQVPWWSSPVTLNTLQRRLRIGDRVSIRYWSTEQRKVVERDVVLSKSDAMIVREYDARYEKPDHEVFGGAVVMQLTVNHMSNRGGSDRGANWIERFAYLKQHIERRTRPMLVVTHVLQSSSLTASTSNLGPGDVITHVNERPVQTLQEYRDAIGKDDKESKKQKYIVWTTEDGMKTAIEHAVARSEYDAWLAQINK